MMGANPIQVAAELLVFPFQFASWQRLAVRVFGRSECGQVLPLPFPERDLGDAKLPGDLGERFAAMGKEGQSVLLKLLVVTFSFLAVHQ